MQPNENLEAKHHEPWRLQPSSNLVRLKNLNRQQIDRLGEKHQELLLLDWENFVWNENKQRLPLDRLVAIQELMRSISVLRFPHWTMDRFKEALDQYVRGEWISSIALCGAIVEFIAGHFFRVEKQRIPGRDQKITQNAKANLLVLKTYNILYDEDYQRLDDVRKIRNKYIHPKKLRDRKSQRKDNLTVLTRLCEFFDEANMKQHYAK